MRVVLTNLSVTGRPASSPVRARLKPAEIARSIHSPASSVRSALRALYDRLILWDDWRISGVRVRCEDPFFAHWVRTPAVKRKHIGSTFDSWLRQEGIYDEVRASAVRRVVARLR